MSFKVFFFVWCLGFFGFFEFFGIFFFLFFFLCSKNKQKYTHFHLSSLSNLFFILEKNSILICLFWFISLSMTLATYALESEITDGLLKKGFNESLLKWINYMTYQVKFISI